MGLQVSVVDVPLPLNVRKYVLEGQADTLRMAENIQTLISTWCVSKTPDNRSETVVEF